MRAGLAMAALLLAMPLCISWLRVLFDDRTPSHSIGRPGDGRREHGHVLPPWGEGFRSYSLIGSALGRQHAHGAVRDTLIAALAERARTAGRVHVLGEMSRQRGGRIHPHRTHQNGLSADRFMPLRDGAGSAAVLSTHDEHVHIDFGVAR